MMKLIKGLIFEYKSLTTFKQRFWYISIILYVISLIFALIHLAFRVGIVQAQTITTPTSTPACPSSPFQSTLSFDYINKCSQCIKTPTPSIPTLALYDLSSGGGQGGAPTWMPDKIFFQGTCAENNKTMPPCSEFLSSCSCPLSEGRTSTPGPTSTPMPTLGPIPTWDGTTSQFLINYREFRTPTAPFYTFHATSTGYNGNWPLFDQWSATCKLAFDDPYATSQGIVWDNYTVSGVSNAPYSGTGWTTAFTTAGFNVGRQVMMFNASNWQTNIITKYRALTGNLGAYGYHTISVTDASYVRTYLTDRDVYLYCSTRKKSIPVLTTATPTPTSTPQTNESCLVADYQSKEQATGYSGIITRQGDCINIVPEFTIAIPAYAELIPAVNWVSPSISFCPKWVDLGSFTVAGMEIPSDLMLVPAVMFFVGLIFLL